jgi:hypothetical protein
MNKNCCRTLGLMRDHITGIRFYTHHIMQTLFDLPTVYPSGWFYVPDFITEKEEAELLQTISGIKLHTFMFQGYEAKRMVASFGYDYSFEKQSLSRGHPIPSPFSWLIGRVANYLQKQKDDFAELLITARVGDQLASRCISV